MSPKDLTETLNALVDTGRPMFIWGPPGVGKSNIVHQLAMARDMHMIDVRSVLLDPVDCRGLPHLDDGRAIWAPPGFWPIKGKTDGRKGIIFLDELPAAPPLVQAALLQGVLDHKIGETEICPNYIWIAAGNRQEDRAGAHRIITPLLNRFGHLDLDVDNAQWTEWALQNGLATEVIGFMNFRPHLLHKFDPSLNERSFPTPRSWHFVSQVLRHLPEHLMLPVITGFVGAGPAVEFVAFYRTYRDLPDVDKLLANPANFKVPTDPAILYALSGAVAERAKGAAPKMLTSIHQVVDRLPDEYAMLTVRDATSLNRDMIDVKKVPAADKFISKHRRVLVKV